MTINITVQTETTQPNCPSDTDLTTWSTATLEHLSESGELCIRLVDLAESQQLNETYRHKNGPTNILSFPQTCPDTITPKLLGDIVVCAPLVAKEAHAQAKSFNAHFAHLIVHGTLHLLGYTHAEDDEAQIMMNHEIAVLAALGFENPYEDIADE